MKPSFRRRNALLACSVLWLSLEAQPLMAAEEAPLQEPSRSVKVVPTGLTLSQALKRALEANPDMSQARLQEIGAKIALERARLDRFGAGVTLSAGDTASLSLSPTWETSADGTKSLALSDQYFTNAPDYAVSAQASLPLYTAGANRARVHKAELSVQQRGLERDQVARGLIRQVYLAYTTLQGYQIRIDAARESLARSREALEITQARLNSGLASPLELNRFKVDVFSQEQALLNLEQSGYDAQQDLVQLLQLEQADLALGEDVTRLERRGWGADPEPLVQKALSSRPELLALGVQEQGLDQDRVITASRIKPTLEADLTASAGASGLWYDDTTFEAANLVPGLTMTAGLRLSWNLFDFYATQHALEQLGVSSKSLRAEAQSQRTRIAQAVRKAHKSVQTLSAREEGVRVQLELATDNLQILQTLYSQGSATVLDVFQARDTWRSALNQEAAFRIEQVVAELELRWLIGEDLLAER